MSERAVEIDDRETTVVGGALVALVLAGVYWSSRIGLRSDTVEVVRSLGLSLFMLALPYWLWRAFRRRDTEFLWTRSQPFLTLATMAATGFVAFVFEPLAGIIGLACSILGGIGAGLVLFSWLRNGAIRSRIMFTLGAIVVAAWASGVVWTSRYKSPLYWETIATNANVHHDPLYYAAMGNMLRTYHIPSTGLDGVPYIFYHYGTPWLYSRWADLVVTDLLSFYSLGYAVIMIPLFLAAIAMLAIEARKASLIPRAQGWLRSNWWGWLALATGTIGVIPDSALYAMAVWNAHVLISESYLGALPVFLMAIATSLIAGKAGRRQWLFLFGFLPVAVASLGFLKLSLMLFFLALVLYVFWRTRALMSIKGIASALVMTGVTFLTYKAVALDAHNGGIAPFHFMRYSTAPGWHQFFPVVHFAWSWIYIAARMYEERITDLGSVAGALRDRRIVDVELVAGLTLLAFLPGEVLNIHGGSAIYFSDVPRWAALALVISRADHWAAVWRERRAAPPTAIRSLRLAPLLAIFVAAPFAITMLMNAVKPGVRLLRQNIATRSSLVSQAAEGGASVPSGRAALFDSGVLETGLRRGQYYGLFAALREIQRIPTSEKSEMLLFIPQSYSLYWSMFDRDNRCTYVSLVAPAVSELALIDGMPAYGCDITPQYNMNAYEPRQRPQAAGDVTDAALCAKASAKGFTRVMVLEPGADGAPGRRTIECGGQGTG